VVINQVVDADRRLSVVCIERALLKCLNDFVRLRQIGVGDGSLRHLVGDRRFTLVPQDPSKARAVAAPRHTAATVLGVVRLPAEIPTWGTRTS
jgi:hypothetical protein